MPEDCNGKFLVALNVKPEPEAPCLKTCSQRGSKGSTGIQWYPARTWQNCSEVISSVGLNPAAACCLNLVTWKRLQIQARLQRLAAVWIQGDKSLYSSSSKTFRFQPVHIYFWNVSVFAENALRSLLEALTSPPYAPMQHLEREQALAKQFAEILHFTLSFDELKVKGVILFNYSPQRLTFTVLKNQYLP